MSFSRFAPTPIAEPPIACARLVSVRAADGLCGETREKCEGLRYDRACGDRKPWFLVQDRRFPAAKLPLIKSQSWRGDQGASCRRSRDLQRDSDWQGDVLDFLLHDEIERQVQPSPHVIIGGAGDEYAARIAEADPAPIGQPCIRHPALSGSSASHHHDRPCVEDSGHRRQRRWCRSRCYAPRRCSGSGCD
jgi:hypothetical protein